MIHSHYSTADPQQPTRASVTIDLEVHDSSLFAKQQQQRKYRRESTKPGDQLINYFDPSTTLQRAGRDVHDLAIIAEQQQQQQRKDLRESAKPCGQHTTENCDISCAVATAPPTRTKQQRSRGAGSAPITGQQQQQQQRRK
jgi:hypothetical protein